MATVSSRYQNEGGLPGRNARERRRRTPNTGSRRHADPADLLAAVRAGDDDAWHEILRRYTPLVVGRARRVGLSPTQADDVAQITWLRLALSLRAIRQPDKLAGWLGTTARNAALELGRREQRLLPTDQLDQRDQVEAAPDAGLVSADVCAAVHAAIDALDERQQALVRVRYLQGEPLPYAQIVEQLDIPPGTIGPTLGRALGQMRRHPDIAALR